MLHRKRNNQICNFDQMNVTNTPTTGTPKVMATTARELFSHLQCFSSQPQRAENVSEGGVKGERQEDQKAQGAWEPLSTVSL